MDSLGTLVLWQCPVCDAGVNGRGVPFRSERAIAYHIVGKSKYERVGRLGPHSRWIKRNQPDADLWDANNVLVNWITDDVRDSASTTQVVPVGSPAQSAPAHDRIMLGAAKIERSLRAIVVNGLREAHGDGACCWCDAPWWFKGFEPQQRLNMLTIREQRSSGGSPIESATIGVLKEAILSGRNWAHFEHALADAGFEDKADFSRRADEVNRLRNDTMHSRREPGEYVDDEADVVEEFATLLEEASGSFD